MRRTLLLSTTLLAIGCYNYARRDAPATARTDVKTEALLIPAGTFTRGDMNGDPDEYPEAKISMNGFLLEKTEVPNASYKECVKAKACDPSSMNGDSNFNQDEQPVVGITWEDAVAYCKWIGRRLPTEAEWEYAARGADQRKWPWSGPFDVKKANARRMDGTLALPQPVTAYPEGASPFGMVNMAGNVAEWVNDNYDPKYYRTSVETENPKGPPEGRERVVKGGGYKDGSHQVRVSARKPKAPTELDDAIGFRCAADQ